MLFCYDSIVISEIMCVLRRINHPLGIFYKINYIIVFSVISILPAVATTDSILINTNY